MMNSTTLASSVAVRLRHLTGRLYALGPRPTFEFLAEIVAGADLFERLERYAELDPAIVRAVGGDTLPPPFLRLVNSNGENQ